MDSLWSRFIFYCWLYILYITVYVTLLQTVLKLSTVTTPRPVPEVGGERRCNVSAVALAVRILQQLTDLSSTSRGKKSQTDTLFIHKWHCQQPIGVAAVFFTRFPLERACDVSFVGVTRRGRIIERWRQQRANGRVKRWYLRQVTCLRRIVRGEQALKYGWLLSLWQVRGAINTHVHKNTLLIWICFPPKVPATVHYARSKAINKTNGRALHFRWHTIGWSLKGKHKGYRGSFGHLSCLLDLRGLIRQTSAEESGDIST